MKLSVLFTALLVIGLSARPAHAISNIQGSVNKLSSFATSGGGAHSNGVGDGGTGGSGGVNPACSDSPENATLLLVLLSGGGLLAGRKLGRVRLDRKVVLASAL